MEITEKEKEVLLLAARKSIESLFEDIEPLNIDLNQYPSFKKHLGAFVTLQEEGKLRGCIGYIITEKTLYQTVCDAARQSAFYDPRFLPLTYDELNLISIEISVLSPPHKIDSYDEVMIGEHGLILNEENIRAVLLPQVAVSNNFTKEQFLSALCQKAGLPDDLWRYRKLNLQVFTAAVFSEEELRKEKNESG
jgi:AmmeMemoRadiSam system protein A